MLDNIELLAICIGLFEAFNSSRSNRVVFIILFDVELLTIDLTVVDDEFIFIL